ncbi:hypothetical protein QBC45DRAFT_360317 [Copromyces sp. CBS 386.78]|nr:hypothetical protein QBC45DRAFT_360317 [Copromyces sp. CBS 386.78]
MDTSVVISNHVQECLRSVQLLSHTVSSTSKIVPETSDGPEGNLATFHALVSNELGRLRIWCSNMGAHRRDKGSLDYRLRDASPIKNQIVRLLEDLQESCDDAASILRGEVIPWDQRQDHGDDEDVEGDMGTLPSDLEGLTELSQIGSEISDIINCLFGMSISIQHPAPHDRFRHFSKTDTSYFKESDIAHIRNKFPFAWEHVVERLGSANSFRRQYFRYREQHNQKLGHGIGTLNGTDNAQYFDTGVSTIETTASSVPLHMRSYKLSVPGPIVDEDTLSEAGMTETSFGFTCAAEGERPKLPAMPDGAKSGLFECPYCYRIVEAKSPKEWRSHIFSDLRPYVCLSLDCQIPNVDYQRRFQWMQHVLENHWKIWKCPKGCKDVVRGVWELRSHIAAFHRDITDPVEIQTLFSLAEHPKPLDAITECELCHEELNSMRDYLRHVGRHQEDIALFSLPDRGLEGDCESDNESEESYGDPDIDAADVTMASDGDNPDSERPSDDKGNAIMFLPEAVTQTVAIDAPVGSNITNFTEQDFGSFEVGDTAELCGHGNPQLVERSWVPSLFGMMVWLPALQRWYPAKVDAQLLAVDLDTALDIEEIQARDQEERIRRDIETPDEPASPIVPECVYVSRDEYIYEQEQARKQQRHAALYQRLLVSSYEYEQEQARKEQEQARKEQEQARKEQEEARKKERQAALTAQTLYQTFLYQFQAAVAVDRGMWDLEANERAAMRQHIPAINAGEPVEICSNREFFELDSRELPAGYVYDPMREEACSSPVLRYLRTWEDRVFADTPIHPYELEAIELLPFRAGQRSTQTSEAQRLYEKHALEHATYLWEVEKSYPFFYHYVDSSGNDGVERADTASAVEELERSERGNAFLPLPYWEGELKPWDNKTCWDDRRY